MKTIAIFLLALQLTSCATILGGPKTEHQKAQQKGQVKKEIQVGFLIADILCGVIPVVVDFATGMIYKKQPMGTPSK
jgi:hypothetical protein